jgi:hypothetical protein
MSKKIFIQLRDTSGSHHNAQEGITLSRSDIKEVNYTPYVQRGIASRLFIEVEAPVVEAPEVEVPEVETPVVKVPEVETPVVEAPEVKKAKK